MAQGRTKLAEKHTKASKKTQSTKKGKRVIPPKKTVAIKQKQATKILSAKITRSIEQQTVAAASSGKLTIMKHAALLGSSSKS